LKDLWVLLLHTTTGFILIFPIMLQVNRNVILSSNFPCGSESIFNKTGKLYSEEYTKVVKAFFTPLPMGVI
jgi:hypothetical protein